MSMSMRKTVHTYIHVAMLSAAIICAGFAIGRAAGGGTDPRVIGYEGYLSQDAGPVSETVKAVFRLFDTQNEGTGTQLWESGVVDLEVVDGWFSVALGDSAPLNPDQPGSPPRQNAFPEGVWASSRLFLAMDINGQPLGGRQEILVSPYAVRAVPGATFRASHVNVDNNVSAGGSISATGNLSAGGVVSGASLSVGGNGYVGGALTVGSLSPFSVAPQGGAEGGEIYLSSGDGNNGWSIDTLGGTLRAHHDGSSFFQLSSSGDVWAPNNVHTQCDWFSWSGAQTDGSSFWLECPNGWFAAGIQWNPQLASVVPTEYIKCCQL